MEKAVGGLISGLIVAFLSFQLGWTGSRGDDAGQPVSSSDGLVGEYDVGVTVDGIAYQAHLTVAGDSGDALVEYVRPETGQPVAVHQDLALVGEDGALYYVGTYPTEAASGAPAGYYAPDWFRVTDGGIDAVCNSSTCWPVDGP